MKLRTELTQQEVDEKGRLLAQLVGERQLIEQEKRDTAKSFKAQIDRKKLEIEELSEEVNTRHEMREVAVQEMREGKHMVTYRCDTGAVFSRRKLTASEEEGYEDIGGDADDLGQRAASGSRIPLENPGPGRARIKKPDAWKEADGLVKKHVTEEGAS